MTRSGAWARIDTVHLFMWSLHVLPEPAWFSPGSLVSSNSPKTLPIGSAGYFNLPISIKVSVNGGPGSDSPWVGSSAFLFLFRLARPRFTRRLL